MNNTLLLALSCALWVLGFWCVSIPMLHRKPVKDAVVAMWIIALAAFIGSIALIFTVMLRDGWVWT